MAYRNQQGGSSTTLGRVSKQMANKATNAHDMAHTAQAMKLLNQLHVLHPLGHCLAVS